MSYNNPRNILNNYNKKKNQSNIMFISKNKNSDSLLLTYYF